MSSLTIQDHPNSPFLLLPRELRDMIYRLVAMTERRIYLRVALKKETKPLKAVFTLGGLGQTNSQLKSEYTAALERRTRQLLRGGKGNDEQLCPGLYSEEEGTACLQMCRTQGADGTYTLSTRSLTLTMPWEFHGRAVREDLPAKRRTTASSELLVASFEIAECENVKLAFRRYFTGFVSCDSPTAYRHPEYWWPKGSLSAMRHLSAAVKATDWRGSMPLFALWHTYGGAIAWMMREKE